jgi:hypothetical protein
MATTEEISQVSIKHAAPHRHRVGLSALFFGLAAAPAAWNAQLLFSVGLSAHACYPRDVPLELPIWSNLWGALLGIGVAGIALAVLGGLVSFRNWRLTFDEAPGAAHHLLDAGEGRTRFLAMFGILTSFLFALGLLFATAAVFLVPICR